jgi:serine/threonine protein kinase/formylglycine-generating enzyme required for sulfatase activity/predicted esterase
VPVDAPSKLCPHCLLVGGFSKEAPLEETSIDPKNTVRMGVPESPLARTAPKRLGNYEILEMIAHGGMGIVYKARHLGLDRLVALKLIRSGVLASSKDVERFQREARSAAKLHHPNIVAIHDIGEQDGQHFFSMDYVPGENLSERARARPFSPRQAAEITAGVAGAIHYSHQQGVLHRDIKPANVILTPEQQPRVLDFGLALVVADESSLTLSGTPMGSPSYMPPEQAAGQSRQMDARSDVYSLGAMLYELLTGRPPFQAASTVETLKLVVENEPVSPRRLNPALPRDLETICLKCLEKAPDRRYQTARELQDELGRFIRDEPIFARPVAQAEKVWRWCRRKPLVAGLSATVAAVLVIAISLAFLVNSARLRRLEDALAAKEAQEERDRVLKTQQEERRIRDSDIPRIRQLVAGEQFVPAFQLAQAANKILPDDPELVALRKQIVAKTTITSEPSGARVWIRDWQATNGERWLELGQTPLQEVEVPQSPRDEEPWEMNQGIFRWRVEKDGYQTQELNAFSGQVAQMSPIYLPSWSNVPPGMVYMPAGREDWEKREPDKLGDFWIDRFEVTNRKFQEFVDAGGYGRREYWKHEFIEDERTIPWEAAVRMFKDVTGNPGPAVWAKGTYPSGEGDYPVRGISWYEAAAYAHYVGKSLPSVHHWGWAANIEAARCIVPDSNFSGEGPAPVGTHHGIGRFDAYDMAGNVAEWCWNESEDLNRCLRGGAWDDPAYVFTNPPDVVPPLNRSPRFGFRCAKYLKEPSAEVLGLPPAKSRDFASETPASPQQIEEYLSHYTYFRDLPLNPHQSVEKLDAYIHETIRIASAYQEEFDLHLFLPHRGHPPYEPIVVVSDTTAFKAERFLVPPGPTSKYSVGLLDERRVICWPQIKGTFGRKKPPGKTSAAQERDLIILVAKDLSRTVDYLQTRPEIDLDKLTFFGGSWGAVYGPTFLVVEPRFKAAILNAGGYMMEKQLPEIEPFQFAPYVSVPILMLNGRYDPHRPIESLQRPFFRDLGSKDKRHVLFNSRHAPPIDEAVKAMDEWLRERFRGAPSNPIAP